MIRGAESAQCPIRKEIIYPGRAEINFKKDSKIFFHFKVIKPDNETIIEDSKRYKRSMELCIGRKFKVPCWEECIKTMLLGEVAKFTIDAKLLAAYPVAACQIRQYLEGKTITRFGCCFENSFKILPYPDLDELNKNPSDLIFIFEIIKVLQPGEYDKDYCFLTDEEKTSSLSSLRSKGNAFYERKQFQEAISVYSEAIVYLDDLLAKFIFKNKAVLEKKTTIRECTKSNEWAETQKLRIPFLLNKGQCHLMLKEYFSAKQTFDEVLKIQPCNIKALYRRAKANRFLWNLDDAFEDLHKIVNLDPTLEGLAASEIRAIQRLRKEKLDSDKTMCAKMLK